MNEQPNIVWMTLDSVRADHTFLDNYRYKTTPEIRRIAESNKGGKFTNCFSHAIITRTSTASIITGTYPSHHQCGLAPASNEIIPEELDTIPELLSRVGYSTGCISRNANSTMGFDRGFERFEWISASTLFDAVDWRSLLKYGLNIRRHSAGFTFDSAKHSTPFLINDMAKRWVRDFQQRNNPFFLYLHYNEPHRPYYPPLPYLDKFTDGLSISSREAADIAMDIHENLYEYVANGLPFSNEEWRALKAMYDAEIAYTDAMVGRLFDYINDVTDGKTIFVVTSDHGELFGEDGVLAHMLSVHDALTNVPMVTYGIEETIASDKLVQHSDFMRLLLEIADAETEQIQGIDPREGSREFTITQRGPVPPSILTDHNPDFDTSQYHWEHLDSIRTTDFKYLNSGSKDELFKLPDEDIDVKTEYGQVADDLENMLYSWKQDEGVPIGDGSAEAEFSEAMKRQLRDLGYLHE